jgi:hypothetical protein
MTSPSEVKVPWFVSVRLSVLCAEMAGTKRCMASFDIHGISGRTLRSDYLTTLADATKYDT